MSNRYNLAVKASPLKRQAAAMAEPPVDVLEELLREFPPAGEKEPLTPRAQKKMREAFSLMNSPVFGVGTQQPQQPLPPAAQQPASQPPASQPPASQPPASQPPADLVADLAHMHASMTRAADQGPCGEVLVAPQHELPPQDWPGGIHPDLAAQFWQHAEDVEIDLDAVTMQQLAALHPQQHQHSHSHQPPPQPVQVDPVPQLPPLHPSAAQQLSPSDPRGACKLAYLAARANHTSISKAEVSVFFEQGVIHPKPKLYVYLVNSQGVNHLTYAACAFTGMKVKDAALDPLLNVNSAKTFVNDSNLRKLVAQIYDNTTAMLPVMPAAFGDESFDQRWADEYQGHLVALAYYTNAANEPKTAKDVVLVALGTFVGDTVYANTRNPAKRVRGLPHHLGLDMHAAQPSHYFDPNVLLGPVHWFTSLLDDSVPTKPVTLDTLMPPGHDDATALFDMSGTFRGTYQLCSDVRLMLSVDVALPAMARDWAAARALEQALRRHAKPRTVINASSKAMDANRVRRVAKVLAHVLTPPRTEAEPLSLALGPNDRSNCYFSKLKNTKTATVIKALAQFYGARASCFGDTEVLKVLHLEAKIARAEFQRLRESTRANTCA